MEGLSPERSSSELSPRAVEKALRRYRGAVRRQTLLAGRRPQGEPEQDSKAAPKRRFYACPECSRGFLHILL